ncbi:type II toxin-antitoxin system RelE/ParE family toxin [Pantoea cypripedii]|uniref:Addiction module toxin RelE n=1 Tax=Pantoea cypripedii TaxID=55209 RepID=A0A6B9GFZ0_PANCY|nr:type II toxin-antitoxin system RelE/ParE family toxin [Pantoea cypripedii]QGY32385.1 hypothetical protein CUN67_25735 [Pantoea cypripedii]
MAGRSRDDLIDFPEDARKEAGKALRKIQFNEEPSDWKPITDWGAGVAEIRIKTEDGAFRVVYVACFEEAIYVLHSFQKKSQKTAQKDVNLIKDRYKALVDERSKKP